MANDPMTIETGLPWQPTMRKSWELTPIKALLTRQNRRVGESSARLTLLSLTTKGIIIRDLSQMKGKFSSSMDSFQHVSVGDFVFCLFDIEETPRTVGQSRHSGMITGAYKVMKPIKISQTKFLEYLLTSIDDAKSFKPLYKGLRKTLPYEVFKGIKLAMPPVAEQTPIVRFLNDAEIRISNAIQAKQRMVTLLNEEKQVIISDLVTRGLDSGTPMRDSGQAWLGQIPAHWEVVRLGSVLQERTETNDKEQVSQVLSLLRKRGVMLYEDKGRVGNKKSENIRRYKIVRENDIVVNCMNVIIGSVGLSNYLGCLSPVYYVLKARNENTSSEYFNNVFQIEPFHKSLVRYGKGILAHRMRISMLDLKAVLVPKPPIAEQIEINKVISTRTSGIDDAIVAVEREIQLLKEYRTVIVSEVVSGKKDVLAQGADLPDVDPADLARILSGVASFDLEEEEGNDGTI
jgi:type I restriction enzyme S subunit